ncbi:MAG: hypothetical protein M5R36_05350 [Deltaproteobacteria bacterium]|nr:hypothetical protein [Deltaproteobacteria bacterium]
MVRTANRIQEDYGRSFDLAVSLGDNTDNAQANEMAIFIDILDGGGLTGAIPGWTRVDSGDLSVDDETGLNRGERDIGIQQFDADNNITNPFFRPEEPDSNADMRTSGLMTPSGGAVPWFTVVGNHDALNTGNFDPQSGLTFFSPDDYTGPYSAFGFIPGIATLVEYWRANPDQPLRLDGGIFGVDMDWRTVLSLLDGAGYIPADMSVDRDDRFDLDELLAGTPGVGADDGVTVAADEGRAFIGRGGMIELVHDTGHGFQDNNDDGEVDALDGGWFRRDWVDLVPGDDRPIRYLNLDSTQVSTLAEGGIGDDQFAWLQAELDAAVDDEVLVIVVSHHSPGSIVTGSAELVAMLNACPNVILHLVGHGHRNAITPRPAPDADPLFGYWEVQTPSSIDFPQQSRIVEIVDNRDGTGTVFVTLFDHWRLDAGDEGRLSDLGRELALDDAAKLGYSGAGPLGGTGAAGDRNRMLVFEIPGGVADKLADIPSDGVITSRDVLGHAGG